MIVLYHVDDAPHKEVTVVAVLEQEAGVEIKLHNALHQSIATAQSASGKRRSNYFTRYILIGHLNPPR